MLHTAPRLPSESSMLSCASSSSNLTIATLLSMTQLRSAALGIPEPGAGTLLGHSFASPFLCRVSNELGAGRPKVASQIFHVGLCLTLMATSCLTTIMLVFRCTVDKFLTSVVQLVSTAAFCALLPVCSVCVCCLSCCPCVHQVWT